MIEPRSIEFFMDEAEESAFLERLLRTPGVVAFQPFQNTASIHALPPETCRRLNGVLLWNQATSPPPELGKTSGGFVCKDDRSEVVRLDFCAHTPGQLIAGRLVCTVSFWALRDDPPTIRKKGVAFRKWFESLERAIRRGGRRREGAYVFPGAARLVHTQLIPRWS